MEAEMIFDEKEPWFKARIDPAALAQVKKPSMGKRIAEFGLDKFKAEAEKRMAEVDALPYEWRLFVHEHGLKKARKAIKEFGQRSAKRATVLTGIRLDALDL